MIKILLFAGLKEQAGTGELEWPDAGMTVAQLKEKAARAYPFGPELHTSMTAVDEEFVDEHYIVKDGDVVAFIPPVSGG